MDMTRVAVVAALGSAAGFAVSTSLQHHAATSSTASALRIGGLLRFLARRLSWHLGLAAGAVALVLHAVAVRYGALVVVQPLIVSGIVLALPVRAALDHRLPTMADIAWVAVTVAGIALLVVAANPTTDGQAPRAALAVPMIVTGAVAAAAFSWSGLRTASARSRGLLLGSAAGILFGLTAGTLKMLVLHTSPRSADAYLIATLIALGAWGLALNQRTYQVVPLSFSMPVLNVVDVVVAICFGYSVFREVPDLAAASLFADAVGLTLMGLGIGQLMRGAGRSASGAPPHFRSALPAGRAVSS
jgi:hypothetical protein